MTVQTRSAANTAERFMLALVLAAYGVLALVYSVVTPPFEASDELWHYPMVKYLADTGLSLPVQDAATVGAWRQEGSQPPLYYLSAAVLTAGIDTSDLDYVRRINPHADIGLVRPDGNVNMIVHRPDAEAFPWRGAILALQVSRLLSVALGLGTVYVTYRLAREIFPERGSVAFGAAALVAFNPMFLFISGSVNNDNLSNLLGNLLTLLIVLLLKQPGVPPLRLYVLLGLVTGAGLLAKLNIGFLIPLVALALLVASVRARTVRPLLVGGVVSGGLTILIAGWWYLRNLQLYGDPTGLNVFLDIVGRRAIPANAAQLWAERHSFTQAYWGFFGGVNVPLPEPVYLIFNLLGGLSLASALLFIAYTLGRCAWPLDRWLPAAVTLLWPIITFVSYLRWTAETPASQGRLVFGAIASISLWMALGVTWPLPAHLRPIVISGVSGFFAAIAAFAPFAVIQPAYAPDPLLASGAPSIIFRAPDADDAIGLLAARVITSQVLPNDYAQIELDWQIITPTARDWSLFVHLVTPDGVIIGQRDIYPAGGLRATSDLAAGSAWGNPVAVSIPPAAYAPITLTVEAGWYHLASGTRMAHDGGETYAVGTVELLPRESALDLPNPLSINFDDQIELVGYALTDLSPAAGEAVELTLYWRGLRPVERDYVVFAHIIHPPTLTIYAGSDAQPVGWTRPTTTWTPGEIIEDTHTLTVNPNTPPGIYELEIGLYLQLPDGFPRLRIITPDGGMANDYAYLTRVRVLPRQDAP